LFDCRFGQTPAFGLFLSSKILVITGVFIEECGEPGKGARFEIFALEGGYRQAGVYGNVKILIIRIL